MYIFIYLSAFWNLFRCFGVDIILCALFRFSGLWRCAGQHVVYPGSWAFYMEQQKTCGYWKNLVKSLWIWLFFSCLWLSDEISHVGCKIFFPNSGVSHIRFLRYTAAGVQFYLNSVLHFSHPSYQPPKSWIHLIYL